MGTPCCTTMVICYTMVTTMVLCYTMLYNHGTMLHHAVQPWYYVTPCCTTMVLCYTMMYNHDTIKHPCDVIQTSFLLSYLKHGVLLLLVSPCGVSYLYIDQGAKLSKG